MPPPRIVQLNDPRSDFRADELDKSFEQVDTRDADKRSGELDLERVRARGRS